MARFAARQAARTLRRQFRDTLTVDVWGIGLTHGSALDTLLDRRCRVDWLPELAPGGYLADPCEVPVDTGRTILVEEFDQATDRGVVSALRSEGSGWRLVSGVIDPGVHASYPSVVEDDGAIHCTAETWQADEVALWRCGDPATGLRWERVATLVEGVPLVDPTVFRFEGTWWLLATRRDAEPDAALHAWTAPDLTGPWRPHPLNPLKVDAASSRPAGRPFWDGDRLVRPAQDCSTGYGAAVVLNEVTRLDESGLVESVLGRLSLPRSRYSQGSHTLSASADGWVVDGRRTGVSRHRMSRELGARWRAVRRRIG